jgi:hypothetical protein
MLAPPTTSTTSLTRPRLSPSSLRRKLPFPLLASPSPATSHVAFAKHSQQPCPSLEKRMMSRMDGTSGSSTRQTGTPKPKHQSTLECTQELFAIKWAHNLLLARRHMKRIGQAKSDLHARPASQLLKPHRSHSLVNDALNGRQPFLIRSANCSQNSVPGSTCGDADRSTSQGKISRPHLADSTRHSCIFYPTTAAQTVIPRPHVIQEPIPATGGQSWPCDIPSHLHLHLHCSNTCVFSP